MEPSSPSSSDQPSVPTTPAAVPPSPPISSVTAPDLELGNLNGQGVHIEAPPKPAAPGQVFGQVTDAPTLQSEPVAISSPIPSVPVVDTPVPVETPAPPAPAPEMPPEPTPKPMPAPIVEVTPTAGMSTDSVKPTAEPLSPLPITSKPSQSGAKATPIIVTIIILVVILVLVLLAYYKSK